MQAADAEAGKAEAARQTMLSHSPLPVPTISANAEGHMLVTHAVAPGELMLHVAARGAQGPTSASAAARSSR